MRHEFWYALRRLRARPWHTAIVVAIFAIGSGAALTVFRIADVVLLRSLPYQGAERIVHIAMQVPMARAQDLPFSDVGYRAIEKRGRAFQAVAGYRTVGTNLTIGTIPERALSARVTGSFFPMLGLTPQLGRLFEPGEETQKGAPLIILSDALWRRSFGARRDVIGSAVRVDGVAATIVGVADKRAALPVASVSYWTLMDLDATGTEPFNLGIEAIARLAPNMTVAAATSDASRVVRDVARENPGPHATPASDFSEYRAVLRPIRDNMIGGVKPTLLLLMGAVMFVLCLTSVNVATLELVRSSGRRGELAVRAALGADRRRLIVGALAEGGIQALVGGVLGALLSVGAVTAVRSLVPDAFGAGATRQWSVGIVMAAGAMMLVCTVASAVFPVLDAMNADVQRGLRERGGSSSKRTLLVRRALVVTQIMFACVLVNGAALMIVTVRHAQQVALGFKPDGLLTLQLSLPKESYRSVGDVSGAYQRLTERLREIPGVQSVGLASNVPLSGSYSSGPIGIEGRPFNADGTDPNVDYRIISAGYLTTMGLSLIAGRMFLEGDGYLDGTPILLSESAARLLWPTPDEAIGHRIRTGPYAPWLPIVGVVSDVRNRALTEPSRPEIYLPFGAPRSPFGISRDMSVVLRTSGSITSVQAAAQRAVLAQNPDLPLYAVRRFDEVLAASQRREITTMRTLTGFAVVALGLAVAGSYAMLMFAVIQRKREMALRRAVGATQRDIVTLIAREMAALLLAGVAAGVIGTVMLSQLVTRFLYGVSALDVRITGGTILLVSIAGLGAALVPARRAASIDPMMVLRSD